VKVSAYDLEQAAAALVTLDRRARRSWETQDFADLARARGRLRPEIVLSRLAQIDLVRGVDDRWERTEQGDEVVGALVEKNWTPYCEALFGLDDVNCEATNLIKVGISTGLTWRCLLVRAQNAAPTLSAVLGWRADFRDGPTLVVPRELLELLSRAHLMATARDTPQWVKQREAVGHRAEAYSMRFEAMRLGAARLLWVSVDVGDAYGYDIEADDEPERRMIEVKGSRGREVSFVMTGNERRAAERIGSTYEIQYWGEISLDREPGAEYEHLVGRGYPRILQDPAGAIDRGEWAVECVAWRVTPGGA